MFLGFATKSNGFLIYFDTTYEGSLSVCQKERNYYHNDNYTVG